MLFAAETNKGDSGAAVAAEADEIVAAGADAMVAAEADETAVGRGGAVVAAEAGIAEADIDGRYGEAARSEKKMGPAASDGFSQSFCSEFLWGMFLHLSGVCFQQVKNERN